MSTDFAAALLTHAPEFEVELTPEAVEKLDAYRALISERNAILHLVAPCSDDEFAVRHILESLSMSRFLPENSRLADVGPGAGLPSLPCVIARGDLKVELVESKVKKTAFLDEAIDRLGLSGRARVINRQFEEIERPAVSHVCCRALDKFTVKLPKLLRWSHRAGLLFFGGPSLREQLTANRVEFSEFLMPRSEQRYLFVVAKQERSVLER